MQHYSPLFPKWRWSQSYKMPRRKESWFLHQNPSWGLRAESIVVFDTGHSEEDHGPTARVLAWKSEPSLKSCRLHRAFSILFLFILFPPEGWGTSCCPLECSRKHIGLGSGSGMFSWLHDHGHLIRFTLTGMKSFLWSSLSTPSYKAYNCTLRCILQGRYGCCCQPRQLVRSVGFPAPLDVFRY